MATPRRVGAETSETRARLLDRAEALMLEEGYAGQKGSPRQAHYSASKGGVIALTQTLALEYASRGITVNTIAPFSVETPMLQAAQDANQLPPREVIERMIPAGRLGTPDDIAAASTFLCSEDAGYITGQVIAPNGGAVL